jgi:hypothetical protein
MNTTFQTTTIGNFLDNFAGRIDMQYYDDNKPIKVAECNRDFVWHLTMQQDFISSILQGFPIPAMCITNGQIVDGGNRSTTLWLFKNGVFQVKLPSESEYISYEKMCENRSLTRLWDSAVIPQQIITNATPDQFAQIYENLNKGVQLSFGQLLENRKHRPWVELAEAIIGRGNGVYEDRNLIQRVWSSRFQKTKRRDELGFAFQVLVGAELGPQHFHLSFAEHIKLIMNDVQPTSGTLHKILELLDSCDPENIVSAKKKKAIFRKFIGAIIHDIYNMGIDEWTTKWSEFVKQAYNTLCDDIIKTILNVGNLRAKSTTRIAGVSENVNRYLDGDFNIDIVYSDETSSDFDDDML